MKKFTEPEILIEQLEVQDVITTSGNDPVATVNTLLGDDQLGFR